MILRRNNDKLKWVILLLFTIFVALILITSIEQTNKAINNLMRNQLSIQKDILSQLDKYKPLRRWKVKDIDVKAKSVLSILVDEKYENQKVLFEKNADQKLAIASITKLMTAFVALTEYNLNQRIRFNQQDIDTVGEIGYFKAGETFFLKDLIYSLLCESSNDAAAAISRSLDKENFVLNMNIEANDLGLRDTFFVDSTGLTEDEGRFNYSTASDVAKFVIFLLQKSGSDERVRLILKATRTKKFRLLTADGNFHHKILNSNKLLYSNPNVISGKTGWTPLAQGCLVLVLKAPNNKGYIINVILGSPNRFEEMEKLIHWDEEAYYW